MSGITLNESVGIEKDVRMESESHTIDPHSMDMDSSGGIGGIDLSFLKAETGHGEIEEYITHPLNFNSSKGMARVLRGLTGMFGSMRYAVIDILIGTLDIMKSTKGANQYGISDRGDYTS